MIGVIDYKAGNAPSVAAALRAIDVDFNMVRNGSELAGVSHIILPGVGAAQATMDSLRDLDLIDSLNQRVLIDNVPFLGICIGLQILFNESDEGNVKCLGWLSGRVIAFDKNEVRVPHMGWNSVEKKVEHPLLEGIKNNSYFYFVNSYHAVLDDSTFLIGETTHGVSFPAIVGKGNILATQFHTEKSGSCGLQLLSNFCKVV